ncbi:MAG: hypothetical protein WCT77_07630 [Bacteroidota bacterium]
MNNSKYNEARKSILNAIHREFVGPLEDEEEMLTENPVTRYAAGMVFPVGYEFRNEDTKDTLVDGENDTITSEDVDNDPLDKGSANSFYPSVMGVSFYCKGNSPILSIEISWSKYMRLAHGEYYVEVNSIPDTITELKEFSDNLDFSDGKIYTKNAIDFNLAEFLSGKTEDKQLKDIFYKLAKLSKKSWKNYRYKKNIELESGMELVKVSDGLELVCKSIKEKNRDNMLYTVVVRNAYQVKSKGSNEENVLFNVSLDISSAGKDKYIFAEYDTNPLIKQDQEEKSLALLYNNRKTFAVGHGCSSNWTRALDSEYAEHILTQALPTYEVPKTDFEIPGLEKIILSMKELSGDGSLEKNDVLSKLRSFCNLYLEWIELLTPDSNIPNDLLETASKHINLCKESQSRMLEGIKILETNPVAYEAFQLANKSMYVQSLHTELQKNKRHPDDTPIQWPDLNSPMASERKWRPFQLAFLLLSINGIVNPSSADRNLLDLVWFPTGGGKTEAYLGLSAFVIFYRRLIEATTSNGAVVIMRYTLRLLTSQQFQRACTLICAMEKLRREDPEKLGNQEISIGLWVGMDSTPNSLDTAGEDLQAYVIGESDKNPSPLLSCPWCGTKMVIESSDGHRRYGCKLINLAGKKANLFCIDVSCPFNNRLPILFVDEEIYRDPPTLLFGTVDKFAQMPLQGGVSRIFAADDGNSNKPPELIIQDELHLISGALGTLVGLYETAIDFLCSKKGMRPKIIASTATIRRAGEQCKNLFDREMRQFPASGLTIDNSFFSKEIPIEAEPGRLYLGIMPSGKT